MTELEHLSTALATARAAPLSMKKAMLAALLIDAEVDLLFEASGEDDVLAFRQRLARKSGALRLVFALCALQAEGPRLVLEPVEVPLADYPGLAVEDYMVSLYNGRTVLRVRIAEGEARHDAHQVLADALAALDAL